jgi:heterotetrameric sarcosine oxidase delta subunit
MIHCPNCGPRPVWELHFGGACGDAAPLGDDARAVGAFLYDKANTCGEQDEWWYHRSGCKLWFVARRDTRTNAVLGTRLADTPPSSARVG